MQEQGRTKLREIAKRLSNDFPSDFLECGLIHTITQRGEESEHVTVLIRGATSDGRKGEIQQILKGLELGGCPIYLQKSAGNGGY